MEKKAAWPEVIQQDKKLREETLAKMRKLENKFTGELLSGALFILISIGALSDFDLLPSLPTNIRAMLGHSPSANMISAALILYIFSAIILILSRMMVGSGKYGGIRHVGYLAGFYFFYHFAGKLTENFWAVFTAGATIIGLESYHLWIYCSEEIEKEREILSAIKRRSERREDREENVE